MKQIDQEAQFRELTLEITKDILSFSETPGEAIPRILEELREISGARVVAMFRCIAEHKSHAHHVHVKPHANHELVSVHPVRQRHLLEGNLFDQLTNLIHDNNELMIVSDNSYTDIYDDLMKVNLGLSILMPMKKDSSTLGGFLILGLPTGRNLDFIVRGLEPLGSMFSLIFRFYDMYMNMEKLVSERTEALQVSEEQLRQQNEEYAALNEEYMVINEELNFTNNQLKSMNTRLEVALKQAEESDRLKTAFLANMSHEIRTPMNGIMGFLSLLQQPNVDETDKAEYLNIMNKSGERLLSTINDIIEISKIESGDIGISTQTVHLPVFLNYYHEFFLPQAHARGVELRPLHFHAYKEHLITDKTKLHSIMTNLINNALKFTEKGSVEFGCDQLDEQTLLFFVKDSGIGIEPGKLASIFERFVQVDMSISRRHEGSGLGLSICKAYVEALGGRIWAESEPGKGSSFYFILPIAGSNTSVSIAAPVRKQNEQDPATQSKCTILIAEDDDPSFLYLKVLLKPYPYEIIRCIDGLEAVEYCKANPALGIILMDIKMPGMDGYEATREIRKFNTDVYIIAQSAYALTEEKKKMMEAGCNAFISKPIDKDKLIDMLLSCG